MTVGFATGGEIAPPEGASGGFAVEAGETGSVIAGDAGKTVTAADGLN